MLDILYYAAVATFVGFVASVAVNLIAFLVRLRKAEWDVDRLERQLDVEDMVVNPPHTPAIVTVDLEAESHGNVVYCFEAGTHKFMCQGATAEELATNLSSRFGNKQVFGRIVTITQDARKLLLSLNGVQNEE